MCGIVGIVGGDDDWVEAVVARLHHRGPDASGVMRFEHCTLGHTRLRVIDVDPVADQPMTNEDRSVWVVFNGELYNARELRRRLERADHTFVSHSDTEVLVHLYEEHGEAMVEELWGMFAFAVWDTREHKLVVARDRLGVKPMYLRPEANGGLAFASEVRALRRPGAAVDETALSDYLQLGWVPGPHTMIAGVEELPPAHALVWERGTIRRRCYWSPPYEAPRSLEADELRSILADSVRRQLVADVPVGVFLSSGVDSSVIATLAAESTVDLQAFTVTFPGLATDEGPAAARFARRLGLRHRAVPIDAEEVRTAIPLAVADLDQPSVDGINTWFVARAVRRYGIVVALSGVGGDELFFGYSTFRHAPRIASSFFPRTLARAAYSVGAYVPSWRHHRIRRAAGAASTGDLGRAYTAVRGLFPISELDRLRPGVAHRPTDPLTPWAVHDGDSFEVGALELANYLPYQLLRDTDTMGMAHSLEIRVPLLDDQFVDAVIAAQCVSQGWSKRVLACAVDRPLCALAAAPKRTFSLPFESWLLGEQAAFALEMLEMLASADLGFSRSALTSLYDGFRARRVSWRSVWALVVLGAWLESGRVRS